MLRHQTNDDDAFDENGLLKDGRTVRVRMSLKDAMALRDRPRVTDAFGRSPGSRPGFLISDHGREAKAQAYLDYERELASRWRDQNYPNGAGSSGPIGQQAGDLCSINGAAGVLRPGPDGRLVCIPNKQSFKGSNGNDEDEPGPDDPEMAASDAATMRKHRSKMRDEYSRYDDELTNAWRRR
jgi:hypothetical protein